MSPGQESETPQGHGGCRPDAHRPAQVAGLEQVVRRRSHCNCICLGACHRTACAHVLRDRVVVGAGCAKWMWEALPNGPFAPPRWLDTAVAHCLCGCCIVFQQVVIGLAATAEVGPPPQSRRPAGPSSSRVGCRLGWTWVLSAPCFFPHRRRCPDTVCLPSAHRMPHST